MAVINGYTIDLDKMKNSTCGRIGVATKGGKKYLCKMFQNPVKPKRNGALDERTIAKNQEKFDAFARRKTRLNETLRTIGGEGGNIVCPVAELVYDDHWTEFSEWIEDAIPDEQIAAVIDALPEEEKLLLLKTATGALKTIHSRGIVHGDLKLPNIMLVRNGDHVVAKLIDFDGSLFVDDVPLEITGTMNYFSPELAAYLDIEEEERGDYTDYITTKSDIFTLGLIFHQYLSGRLPESDYLPGHLQRIRDRGQFIYPWQVTLAGDPDCYLQLDPAIREPWLVALIADMLDGNPEKRPSASEVLGRLNTHRLPIETEGWPEDGLTIDPEKVQANHWVGLCKIDQYVDEETTVHAYEVTEMNGRKVVKSAAELMAAGCAAALDPWCDPWPEDGIRWDTDQLTRYRYRMIVRGPAAGQYRVTDQRGVALLRTRQQLLMLKLAVAEGGAAPAPTPVPTPEPAPTPAPTPAPAPGPVAYCEPWPEDAIRWHAERLEYVGCRGLERGTAPGLYRFTDRRGNTMIRTRQQLVMQRLAAAEGAPTPAPAPAPAPTPDPAPAPAPAGEEWNEAALWPEDAAVMQPNPTRLTTLGWTFLGKSERIGLKGYLFQDRIGQQRFLRSQMVLVQMLAIRK